MHGNHAGSHKWRIFIPELLSALFLVAALTIPWGNELLRLISYITAVLPVGIPVLASTLSEWRKGDIFNEFTLMAVASAGAFILGEYPEGVAVLLFYSVGEKLEGIVSGDVREAIKRLIGKIPKTATVIKNGEREAMNPADVIPGMIIAVRPGESVPLDGILVSDHDEEFNTSAITGESVPRSYSAGDRIMSGIIPVSREVRIKVSHRLDDSSMNRILKMIEDASAHRSPSESILRRIARWYTPAVICAAVLISAIPWIVSISTGAPAFEWTLWLRRSLVFLVCSCPCALIVSIPLTYFASIGIASGKGILFKGHDSLESIRKSDIILFDKTGTVTTGEFHVESVTAIGLKSESEILALAASIEQESPHPLARAMVREAEARSLDLPAVTDVFTVTHGIRAIYCGSEILIGSGKMMQTQGIVFPGEYGDETFVLMAIDRKPAGIISLSDSVKAGASEATTELRHRGITSIGILSGDRRSAVKMAADSVGADFYMPELLPADKQKIITGFRNESKTVAFVGDGVNDAPALAASDVGIAMGNIGMDIAIDSAGIVIAGDDLRKISEAFDISRRVKSVIIENVAFAFGVKILVMVLGAFGIASLWAAVFADTGVTVVTVLWTLYRLKIWQLRTQTR